MLKNRKPIFDQLEDRKLLTQANIASYFEQYIHKTPKDIYALPGMVLSLAVDSRGVSPTAIGLKQVVYSVNGFGMNSQYNFDIGDFQTVSSIVDQRLDNNGNVYPDPNMLSLAQYFAPKEDGDYIINVSATVTEIRYIPFIHTVDVIYTDQLKFTIESPNVSEFSVDIDHATRIYPGDGAMVITSADANDPNDAFIYTATIENDTHYSVLVGYMQIIDNMFTVTYENKVYSYIVSQLLDSTTLFNNEWNFYSPYEDYGAYIILPNTTKQLIHNTEGKVRDIPRVRVKLNNGADGNLLELTDLMTASTHVVIRGGYLSGANWSYNNIPIALSTAVWQFGGSVSASAQPGNWIINSVAPNGASHYNGDGIKKNIEWTGNVFDDLYTKDNEFEAGNTGKHRLKPIIIVVPPIHNQTPFVKPKRKR